MLVGHVILLTSDPTTVIVKLVSSLMYTVKSRFRTFIPKVKFVSIALKLGIVPVNQPLWILRDSPVGNDPLESI